MYADKLTKIDTFILLNAGVVAYNADVLLAGGQGTNYEQSLFFLSPSCETRGTKITSVWEATDIKGKSKNLACVDGGIRR